MWYRRRRRIVLDGIEYWLARGILKIDVTTRSTEGSEEAIRAYSIGST